MVESANYASASELWLTPCKRRIIAFLPNETLPMYRTFKGATVVIGLSVLMIGCSAVEVVPPADPSDEYVFACDKVDGQPGCETQADVVCPLGYDTLSSEEDFDRKELRVRCSSTPGSVRVK